MTLPGYDLHGKAALLFGVDDAFGRALALVLAEAGADTGVVSVRPGRNAADVGRAALDEVQALGRKGFAAVLEANATGQFDAICAQALDRFGRLDVLVNNFDLPFAKPSIDTTADELARVLIGNVSGVFLAACAAARVMIPRRAGTIVNVTSVLGERGMANAAGYTAAKAAVTSLTRSLAVEWGPLGISVTGLGISFMEGVPGFADDPDVRAALERYLPMRRLTRPEDVAPIVAYLASDKSGYLTGDTIFFDGAALSHG